MISWSASLGIYVWTGERAVLNQHIFKVVFDKCEVDKSFFVHQVQNILEKAASSAHGATMKHLTKPVFDALPFYLPPLEEQRRIAALLDKVSDLIAKRRAQLDKLDLLVKARFVEMFGDPLLDSGKYPKVPLGSLAEVGSSKRIFEKEYVSEGVPFYRTKEIVELSKGNRITTELFITRERYDEISREYGVPQTGDLLISAVGTIGVIWIVDGKNDFYFKDGNLLRVVISIYAITAQNRGVVFEHRLSIYVETQTIYSQYKKIMGKASQVEFQRQKSLIATILFGFNTDEGELIEKYLNLSSNESTDALVEYMDTYISKYLSNSLVENCKIFYNEDISTQVGKLYSSYDIFRMTFLVYTEEEMMQAYQEIKAVLNEFQQKNILKKMKRKLPI